MVEVGNEECCLIPVENTRKETLIPLILQYILPGTTVHTDSVRVYNILTFLGYYHLKVNHSVGDFVNQRTGATINHIESLGQKVSGQSK